jgi:two-component system response regulator MprA
MGMPAGILLVDDDPAVLSSLRRALTLGDFSVTTASDGESALSELQKAKPDLVVLDVMLPGIDGLTLCERVRQLDDTPILMLSARDTVPDRVAGLARGADDYLVKPFAIDELLARVRALLRRGRSRDSKLRYADVVVDEDGHQAYRAGEPLALTPREYELLALLVRNARRALSREQLGRQAWGYVPTGESNFVDVAVKELRKKLEAMGQPRLIQTIRGFGYVLREEP